MREHGSDPDEIRIPISAGVPMGVRIAYVACAGLAIFILGLVAAASSVNHVWPSINSLKYPL